MKPKVLVINHDELLMSLMDQLLSDEGLAVTTDQIDEGILERIGLIRPDALVAGLSPLDERSKEFLAGLARDPQSQQVPTVLLTTSERVAREINESDEFPMVRRVLLKPFDIDVFLSSVKEAVVSKEG